MQINNSFRQMRLKAVFNTLYGCMQSIERPVMGMILLVLVTFIGSQKAMPMEGSGIVPIISILLLDEDDAPIDIKKIAAGRSHSCALLIDGTVRCWGSNEFGQLGFGVAGSGSTSFPVRVSTIENAVAMAAGKNHTCVILDSGDVFCWGENVSGQLGAETPQQSIEPVKVVNVENAISISAGQSHSCATINDGQVKCWCRNVEGQLGDGSNVSNLAVSVNGIDNAQTVSTGAFHSCAGLETGRVKCWGKNDLGQLGVDGDLSTNEPVEISSAIINNANSVVSGLDHSCALLADKKVKCWGDGSFGQSDISQSLPAPILSQNAEGITTLSDAVDITAGWFHNCVLRESGSVSCWGRGGEGQLGSDSTSRYAVETSLVYDVNSIAAGGFHTCVMLNSGRVKCWGSNDSSQSGGEIGAGLGGDGGNDSPRALTVIGIKHATSVATGREHSCARLVSGQVECWGANQYGQLGDGADEESNVPTLIDNFFNVSDVTTGEFHSCALQNTGKVLCWGVNIFGQLGDGTNFNSDVPKLVSGIENATTVSAGSTHSCAVLTSGIIRCWGSNRLGALGNGSSDEGISTTPVDVRDITSAKKVSVGLTHSCALLNDGQVHCWGSNVFGKLGIGSDEAKSNYPRPVIGISDAIDVAVGILHSCAVLASGQIECWGSGEYGELGNGIDGVGFYENAPVVVSGISDATAISLGLFSTCARLASGQAVCWGINNFGQLGLGNMQSSNIPVPILDVDNNLNSISAGFNSTCSTHSDGAIRCWGRNDTGQLGIGSDAPDEITRPVIVH